MAASALLHALVLAIVLERGVPSLTPPLVAIPVALVGAPGGGGGAAGPSRDGPSGPPSAAAPSPPAPSPEAPVARRRVAARRPAAVPAAATAPDGAPAGEARGNDEGGRGDAGGGDSGGGDGSGGDGSGGARVAYGANPLPPYPVVARRLGKEGLVLLEVLVAPDGRAADVRVLRSSGFAPLDESAATTVRGRWRFVPARRGGEAVAARVTVPIRFRLDDSQG